MRQVVVPPPWHMPESFHQHRREVVGQQLDFLMDMFGGHLVHEREVRHDGIQELDRDIHPHPSWIRFDSNLRRQRKRLEALPVRHGPEGGSGGEQVVQMGGAGAGQARDDNGWQQLDPVDLGMSRQQVGEQQPVLEPLDQLREEVDDARRVHAVDLVQCGEIDVETLPVIVGAEVVEAGICPRLVVQRIGVERTVGRHRTHQLAQLPPLGAEAGFGEVLELNEVLGEVSCGVGHATYVTLSFVMTTDLGRPRDPRIDDAVLRATVQLIGKTGYGDLREMMRRTVAVLPSPAARAALPGLVGEMATDLTLHTALLERFGDILSRGLTERLDAAAARGAVRPDVTAADLVEALAGITFLALLTRGEALDDAWVERAATMITRGISA